MRIPNLSEIPDLAPVPAGEYGLQITKSVMKRNKDDNRDGHVLTIKVLGEENVLPINHSLWFGSAEAGDDKEKADGMDRRAKEFYNQIGIDTSEDLEVEDFVNIEFTALLKVVPNFFDNTPENEIVRVVQ